MTPGNGFFVYRGTDATGNEMIAPDEDLDFMVARPGDHLFCLFECDYCAFFKLCGRLPSSRSQADSRLQTFVRRANLDAFWTRRSGTISQLVSTVRRQVEVGQMFGFTMYPNPGPVPFCSDQGMRVAVGTLWQSIQPGRRRKTSQVYSSVKKVRGAYSDMYHRSCRAIETSLVFRTDTKRQVASSNPVDSEWYWRFQAGLRARIGDSPKQDLAISHEVMLLVQAYFEAMWKVGLEESDLKTQKRAATGFLFFGFTFVAGLRGFEVPKIVLHELRGQIRKDPRLGLPAHVAIPLLGRFKSRSSQQQRLVVFVVYETPRGLRIGEWVERLIAILESEEVVEGWLFQDQEGEQAKMSDHFGEDFFNALLHVQEAHPDAIPQEVDVIDDYGLARSGRRGADTEATNAGVSSEDIDWIHRWNTGGEELSAAPMRVLYADRRQLLRTYLRYSQAF